MHVLIGSRPDAEFSSLRDLLATQPGLRYFLHGHTEDVWTLDFSPDGKLLASGSSDGRLLLWNVEAGRLERHLDHCPDAACPGERIKRLAFSPSGRYVLTGLASLRAPR